MSDRLIQDTHTLVHRVWAKVSSNGVLTYCTGPAWYVEAIPTSHPRSATYVPDTRAVTCLSCVLQRMTA